MDQLKQLLSGVKKYQFWVICCSILVVSPVCWWLATGTLASQTKQRKSKLDGEFNSVSNIQPKHPNQGVIDAIRAQHGKLKEEVLTAWDVLYREQKEKNPLPKVLSKDFKREFESLKPKGELGRQYREEYQNFIKEHFGTLESIIDRRRPVKPKEEKAEGGGRTTPAAGGVRPGGLRPGRAGIGYGGMAGARPPAMPGVGRDAGREEEWIGTVEWDDSDYNRLEEHFVWEEAPSTLAVLLAQEDLWVNEALLRVIKNTNEGATGHATAPVKRIEALEIGKDAAKAWKGAEDAIFKAGQTAGQPGVPGGAPGSLSSGPGGGNISGPAAPSGLPGMAPGLPGGAVVSSEQMAAEQARRDLIEGRYVDDKDQPLAYEAAYPYAKHPYAEFKMMPIRMKLAMDQRRLPRLLVECANSNMPIEVRRIRIQKSAGEALDLAGAAAPAAAPGPGPAFGKAHVGPMPGRKQPRASGAVKSDNQEAGQYDMPVEILGVIYIYNPPDREKLGTGAAAAGTPPAGAPAATPGTPPIGPAPAAAPPATKGAKP
jgi:hypothetical protein